MEQTQLLKGILEGCVLEVVSRGETYGYKITSDLQNRGFSSLNEGSIYPVLIRLEKKKYVVCVKVNSPKGPRRKMYSISSEGKAFLAEFKETWNALSQSVSLLMRREE